MRTWARAGRACRRPVQDRQRGTERRGQVLIVTVREMDGVVEDKGERKESELPQKRRKKRTVRSIFLFYRERMRGDGIGARRERQNEREATGDRENAREATKRVRARLSVGPTVRARQVSHVG